MSDTYKWPGGREAILRIGPATGPMLLVAPALFEEANRTRAFTVAVMRALARSGIGSALPDLPGTNESLVATEDARLADWRAAFAAAASDRPVHVLAIRGGALVDGDADAIGRYHLSPLPGHAIVRDLVRSRLAGLREGGDAFDPAELAAAGPPVELAGNPVARELLAALNESRPAAADRIARLGISAEPADVNLPGRPLWRASEPDVDHALVAALAGDVSEWVARCGG